MMENVLVTGARGFLGSAVVRALTESDFAVVEVARTSDGDCCGYDLSDPIQVCQLLDHFQPNSIVNCAAKACFLDGALAAQYPINTLAPGLMADWCQKNDRYLCQVSGALVHGNSFSKAGPGIPEVPDGDYGVSKFLAEQLIKSSGCAASMVRFGGIFGKTGPDHLGLNGAIRKASQGVAPCITGEGTGRRNYIHVLDAAKVLVHCIQNRTTGVVWSGGRDTLSIAEIMLEVAKVYGLEDEVEYHPGPETSDQIVYTSEGIPLGRSFYEALLAEQ